MHNNDSRRNIYQLCTSAIQLRLQSNIVNFMNKLFSQICFQTVASAICGFYEQVKKIFLPTPHKFYYLFSLRDISRIFEYISLVPAKKLASPEKLMRLWAHETNRVYFDRHVFLIKISMNFKIKNDF